MTNKERREHAELIHKFGCSDITAAQLERLAVLDSLGGGGAEPAVTRAATEPKGHNAETQRASGEESAR